MNKLTQHDIQKFIYRTESHSLITQKFCQQSLQTMGLDYFSYLCIDPCGRVAAFCTNMDLFKKYWQHECYLDTPYMIDLSHLEYFMLHSELDHFSKSNRFSQLFEGYDVNKRNGAVMIIPEPERLCYVNYAGQHISNSTISTLAAFMEKFMHKFEIHFKHHIETALKDNIIFPNYQQLFKTIPLRPSILENQDQVSKREFSCLEHYIAGKSYAEISEILFISERTIANHLQNIKQKNNINSLAGMIDLYLHMKYSTRRHVF